MTLDFDNTLFGRLRAAAGDDWRRYVDHDFVRGLGDGSLPEAAFRHYLIQDYLFLIQFARAYALAAYKADTIADMRAAAAVMSGILDTEMGMHVSYCADWGLSEADMASAPEDMPTIAYTRFVLDRGQAGDLLDLHTALAPCVVGYAEIGAALAAAPDTQRDGNPYVSWIDMYASDDYQAVAADAVQLLDDLGARAGAAARFDRLAQNFAAATRLEIAFWQMGLDAADD